MFRIINFTFYIYNYKFKNKRNIYKITFLMCYCRKFTDFLKGYFMYLNLFPFV